MVWTISLSGSLTLQPTSQDRARDSDLDVPLAGSVRLVLRVLPTKNLNWGRSNNSNFSPFCCLNCDLPKPGFITRFKSLQPCHFEPIGRGWKLI